MAKTDAIQIVIAGIEQGYDKLSWHGTNLRGSLRGLALDRLCWRPAENRHNVWEIAVHAAYWKYTVRRRITGEKRGSFYLQGSNWFPRPMEKSLSAWQDDLAMLQISHDTLVAAVADLSERTLFSRPKGSKYTLLFYLQGIAAHDLYHAGQIQLLKRLFAAAKEI
jgi:uncharacterized damage-inducible protein DinB